MWLSLNLAVQLRWRILSSYQLNRSLNLELPRIASAYIAVLLGLLKVYMVLIKYVLFSLITSSLLKTNILSRKYFVSFSKSIKLWNNGIHLNTLTIIPNTETEIWPKELEIGNILYKVVLQIHRKWMKGFWLFNISEGVSSFSLLSYK